MPVHEIKALAAKARCGSSSGGGGGSDGDGGRARLSQAVGAMVGSRSQITELFKDRDGNVTVDADALLE